MKVFVDSSVFIRHFYGEKEALKILNRILNEDTVYVNSHVVEETFFKLLYIETHRLFGKTGRFYLRDMFKKHLEMYKNVREYLQDFLLNGVSSGLIEVLPINASILNESIKIAFYYSLLPNDALIAATCKFYRIKHIATFDEDFSKVPFLKRLEI